MALAFGLLFVCITERSYLPTDPSPGIADSMPNANLADGTFSSGSLPPFVGFPVLLKKPTLVLTPHANTSLSALRLGFCEGKLSRGLICRFNSVQRSDLFKYI